MIFTMFFGFGCGSEGPSEGDTNLLAAPNTLNEDPGDFDQLRKFLFNEEISGTINCGPVTITRSKATAVDFEEEHPDSGQNVHFKNLSCSSDGHSNSIKCYVSNIVSSQIVFIPVASPRSISLGTSSENIDGQINATWMPNMLLPWETSDFSCEIEIETNIIAKFE
jgi:hypothetical protein